jgi:hypothetical protein
MSGRFRSRLGVGLLEMLIAVTVLSLVLAAMVGVLLHQQRFYLVAGDAASTVSLVERVEIVVTGELRPLNPAAGDLTYAGADSFALRAFRGVYSVCAKRLAGDLLLTVRSLTDGPALTADSALVYSSGVRPAMVDDYWRRVEIASVQADVCPDGTPGWTATIADIGGLFSEVSIGAPLRLFRRASYWLTQEGGFWYLKTDALSGSPMVVSGPLAPADSAPASVLKFEYLDASGNPALQPADVVGIVIRVAAVGSVPKRRGGGPLRKERTVAVRLRNASG